MLKRVLAAMLMLVMIFSITACGSKEEETASPIQSTQIATEVPAETVSSDENKITFETPVVLIDNDNFRLELLRFWKKDGGYHYIDGHWTGGKEDAGPSVGIDFQIYNKGTARFYTNCDGYIGDTSAISTIRINGNSNGSPAPGKNASMRMTVALCDGENEIPIDIEDLYQLNGSFSCFGSGIKTENYDFSIQEALNVPTAESGSISSLTTDTISIDAIAVDDSYQDKNGSPLKMVYLFYTVSAKDSNIEMGIAGTKMTINNANTYQGVRAADAAEYAASYYNSAYLQTIYMGTQLKCAVNFKVPEADLAPGRNITLSDSDLPDMAKLRLSTDDIQHFESRDTLCKTIDPAGYEKALFDRQTPDDATLQTVKRLLNGTSKWRSMGQTVLTYAFMSPNKFELRTSANTCVTGTYEVTNRFIILHFDSSDLVEKIPYAIDNGAIDLDLFGITAGPKLHDTDSIIASAD